jgi:hypothetical protein
MMVFDGLCFRAFSIIWIQTWFLKGNVADFLVSWLLVDGMSVMVFLCRDSRHLWMVDRWKADVAASCFLVADFLVSWLLVTSWQILPTLEDYMR